MTTIDNLTSHTIGFRKGRLIWFALLSTAFVVLISFVVFWIQPPDLSGGKEILFLIFGVFMLWFAEYNWRLLAKSWRGDIALEMDNEGFVAQTMMPSIRVKIKWSDIVSLQIFEQQIFLSSIEQLHIVVPNIEPYSSAQYGFARFIRRYQAADKPVTFIINVQQLDTTSTQLAAYMADFAGRDL